MSALREVNAITSLADLRNRLVPTEVKIYCNRETYTKVEPRAEILRDESKSAVYTLVQFSILQGGYRATPLRGPVIVEAGPYAQHTLSVRLIAREDGRSRSRAIWDLTPQIRAFPALLVGGAIPEVALDIFNENTAPLLEGPPLCIRTARTARLHELEWEFIVDCFELKEIVRLFNTDEEAAA